MDCWVRSTCKLTQMSDGGVLIYSYTWSGKFYVYLAVLESSHRIKLVIELIYLNAILSRNTIH